MKGLCLEYKCRIMECGIKYVIWILLVLQMIIGFFGFLKKNAFKIADNHIFRKGRRIAALALKVNVGIYRALMLQDLKKNKGIN